MADFSNEEAGSQILIFVIGLLVGAVVSGVLWWALPEDTEQVAPDVSAQVSDGQRASASAPGQASEETDPTSAPQDPAAARLDRCEEVYQAQGRPLQAVAPAMSQWELHIGAMNKLVAGAISLPQATQYWNQTRVGARENLQKFTVAQREFDERTARCPAPPDSQGVPTELRSCIDTLAARSRTLRTAATALQTWRAHAAHMEMLRRGEMSPEEATRLWLRSWHQGNREVRAYHAAARASGKVDSSHHHGSAGSAASCVG